MTNLIGFTIDLISFIFAVLALPICTAVFWLGYDNQEKTDTDEDCSNLTDKNNTKGEIP